MGNGVEQFIVQFPALAAYLIVLGGAAFMAMVGFGGRHFFKRMDEREVALMTRMDASEKALSKRMDAQDMALAEIPDTFSDEIKAVKLLIQTEIKELREGQHRLANRVVSIEAFNKAKFSFEHPSALNAPADSGRIP